MAFQASYFMPKHTNKDQTEENQVLEDEMNKRKNNIIDDVARSVNAVDVGAPQTQEKKATTESKNGMPEKKVEFLETTKKKPKDEEILDEAISGLRAKLIIKKKKPTKIPTIKDEITIKVEKIMEEGLREAYEILSAIQKQEFKIKGEETAWKIRQLLRETHVKVKKIFRLLFDWLKMLPGINRFFLEQEAKIKTDKIIVIKEITGGQ